MIKQKAFDFCQNLIIYLLFLFIVCEHHVSFTAVKNISLYTAVLLGFTTLFLRKDEILQRIKLNFSHAKISLIFLALFVAYALLISCFPYDDSFGSAKKTFSEFGRGIAFLFVILVCSNGEEKQKNIIFYSILSAFIFITAHHAFPIFENLNKISSQNPEEGRIVHRGYSLYVDRFMVFTLLGIIFFKNNAIKVFIVIFCCIAIAMDILSGARGSWFSVFTVFILLFVFLFFSKYNDFLKINFKKIFAVGALCFLSIGVLFFNSSIANSKLSQGLNSSGRDLILKERLPLLFETNRWILGLGHSEHLYDKFLADKSDEKSIEIFMTSVRDGKKHWFNDEPFFIGNIYYYGVIGVSFLFLSFLYLLRDSFRSFRTTQNLLFAGVFISAVSYFGIRGLFETYNLRILYLFYLIGFLILFQSKTEVKNER